MSGKRFETWVEGGGFAITPLVWGGLLLLGGVVWKRGWRAIDACSSSCRRIWRAISMAVPTGFGRSRSWTSPMAKISAVMMVS